MQYIDTGGELLGHYISNSGDISVVFENALSSVISPGSCIGSKEAIEYIAALGIGKRLASIHVVNPNRLEQNKKHAGIRILRKNWERILVELPENTKRILLLCPDQDIITGVIARPLSVLRPSLDDIHGSIFTLPNGVELVPTYDVVNQYHKNKYRERDLVRLLNLKKPNNPLPYVDKLPKNLPAKHIVLDLETDGNPVHFAKLTAVGIQWCDLLRFIVRFDEPQNSLPEYIALWLLEQASKGSHFWMHNAAFDLSFLGSQFRSASYGRIHDTMMRARAGGSIQAGLKHLGNFYTDRPGNYAWLDLNGQNHDFSDPTYLAEDLEVTWLLAKKWNSYNPPIVQLAEKCQTMLCEQTLNGTKIDGESIQKIASELPAHIQELRKELTEIYGADPDDSEALGAALRKQKFPISKTATGKYSITKDKLKEWGLDDLVEYREAKKLEESFVSKITSLLLPNYILPHSQGMLAAKTGRTSMKNFNWQQAGRKGPVRSLMISRFLRGYVGAVDLKQAELRGAAYVSNDRVMADDLMGPDMHTANAVLAERISWEEVTDDIRTNAKITVFRGIYGGMPQNEGQQRVKDVLDKKYKGLKNWIYWARKQSIDTLYAVDAWGKRCNLSDLYYPDGWNGSVKRTGQNAYIQGLASHTSMYIMLRCWELFREYRLQSLVLLGVHDSTMFDIHPDEVEVVGRAVQQAFRDLIYTPLAEFELFNNPLPMEGDLLIGKCWADLKEPKPGKESKLSFEPIRCSSKE